MSVPQYPSSIFQTVEPKFLQPHASYLSIYGDDLEVFNVINLISNYQYPRPLLINQENTIVNGYLYWKAALSLGWTSIPIELREFSSPETELEALLLENVERSKTNEQKVREALAWEQIEKAKAKQRQQLGAIMTNEKLGRKTLQENFPVDAPCAASLRERY
jgi:ParB-like chromosome segregation protein Spo0J